MDNINKIIKTKLQELKSNSGRLFGLTYPYIFILITIIGFLYIFNMNYTARQNVSPPLPDSTKQADLPVIQAKTIAPIDITKIGDPTPDLLAKGKNIFTTVCISCHGEGGKGDGPAGSILNPKPQNFTSKIGWKNGPKLNQIYKTLSDGIPGSGMASYAYLTPEEKFGLAHYIRTTFVQDPPKDSPADLKTLDQLYNLSQGQKIPAQIPVSVAAKFVINENDSLVQNTSRIVSTISSNISNPAVQLFNKVTDSKYKAVVSLERSFGWKQNEQTFVNQIINNVNLNGFNYNVFNLSGNDWDLLHKYCIGVIN
ncbi:MAG: cytochrome c [Ignavibacteriaceae bacterium]|nr:cytochrome c [Ignavibacteriaceae bacterium]